jgi:signal transduction histidine kinase/CheY-like chemotaxis protein
MRIANMKIRTRMLIGFGALLAMTMVLGGIAFWHTGIIWENNKYLYRHPFKVNIAVREIQTHVLAMQRSLKNVVLAETQNQVDVALHSMQAEEAEVYRLFDTVRALYLGKRASVDSAVNAFRDWRLVREQIIRANKPGIELEPIRLVNSTGEAHVWLILSKLRVLQDFAMKRANGFYSAAEQRKEQLYSQLWLILIAIVIASVVLVVLILRGITVPLKHMISFAEKYGKGQYNLRNQYDSSNELGVLSASMNKLAEAVEFDMNVKAGTMELADTMLANDELPVFCEAVLGMLMQKTRSNLGAVYLLNETTASFDPYISFGFSKENLKSFAANSFEGDFGTILNGKTPVKVTQIPDDSVFIFSTVAGTIRPKEIVMVPVIRRNTVVAIVSLASLEAYSAESLEIIRRSEKNLNMSFNAVMAFEQITEYAESLDRHNEKLNSQARELQAQTSELVEQNTELEIQKRQIDEANRHKSQFLSSMSHELRTPLNSVIALSGVLGKRLKDQIPEEEYGYLDIIERNGKNLLALINDILDLSRIEAGKTEISYEQVSLHEIIDYILISLKIQISEKSLRVSNHVSPDLPLLFTDGAKCQQILQNLISNAVKFTDSGFVEITAQEENGEVTVTVRDSGIGIPADQLPFIFNEFRQVDGSTSRRYGGTGLGLAIVEKFAAMLGIRVGVESEPGKGSVFTLTFPAEASQNKSLPHPQPVLPAWSLHYAHLPALSLTQAGSKTILIVEDSEPAIIQLTSILREQGYRFEIARNGKEALDSARIHLPHAIILDLMMPGMDGFDVLEQIRSTVETRTTPVLILTAKYLTQEELRRLTANHIHQLVQKGAVNKSELLGLVRQMLFPASPAPDTRQEPAGKMRKVNAPARILIIDDNPDNVTTLRVLLDGKHTVFTEHNGQAGVESVKRLKPDLIFLDISLPGLDGFQVFDLIRKEPGSRHIPVIAVTARAMKGDREQILSHGFDGYISKPIDHSSFGETLSAWIL